MANMMVGGSIQTIPEVAQSHASKLSSINLNTSSPNVTISYTDIGEIHTGAEDVNNSYQYANEIQTDVINYAKDILDLSNKIVADDQASAQEFKN